MNFSFVFKLYFSSAFNYVQLNYKFLPCIFHSLLTSKLVVPYVSSRTHPKSSPRVVAKKSLCNLGRARSQKGVFPLAQEKNGGRVQKNDEKNNDVLVPEMKN